jgi:hypothetical protein
MSLRILNCRWRADYGTEKEINCPLYCYDVAIFENKPHFELIGKAFKFLPPPIGGTKRERPGFRHATPSISI